MSATGACGPAKTDTQFSNMSLVAPSGAQKSAGEIVVLNKLSISEHLTMYRKFFFEKGNKVPPTPLPQQQLELSEIYNSPESTIKAAWLGHSSMLINLNGYTVLTDPVFENKVSPIGPTRFNRQLPLQVKDLPFVDVVIVSHNHYDHLNKFSIQSLAEKTEHFIVPLGVGKQLLKWGVDRNKIVELNWWEEYQVSETLEIVATPSQHFSGRGLFDRNKSLWASWVIQSGEQRLFFSGDSGYFNGFKKIGEKYGPFDVTFLECGAYNEHWSNVHMFPEETVQAFFDLGGKILQPIHWATFNLSLHPWFEPVERLNREALNRGAAVSLPMIGEVVDYTSPLVPRPWWRAAMDKVAGPTAPKKLVANVNQ